MSAFTTIKVEFGSQLRRLAFDSAASSWAAVRAQILTSYGIAASESDQCALHYLDDENDLISVNSDSEFAEAIRCAKQKNKILKVILSKSEKAAAKAAASAADSDAKYSQQESLEQKAPLLKLAVDARSDSDIRVEDAADGDADQQVEEMDLPLDRRDLLSRSPTLSEASDSSFVSINAQSLRDELDEKEEQPVEEGNDSSVLKAAAAAMDEDAKAANAASASASAAATPSQPEFAATDRAVVQDVMKQLAQDIIQLKPETPTAASAVSVASNPAVQEKSVVDGKAEVAVPLPKQESKVDVDSTSSASAAGMKVKELRSVVEGVINEKFLGWLDDLLAAVDNLDHADEDVKRVHQLTARIRLGLADVSENRQYLQRISDGMAKKMMRVMRQAQGKPGKSKEDKQKEKPQPKEDEEDRKKASPPSPPPAPTASAAATSSSCASTNACAVVVHDGVTCDGCNMSPISGVRFHCISCDQIEKVRRAGGYDLCESCESKGVHQLVDGKRHVMIKIKIPTKVIVDIEAPRGPITGPAVYDVLRVNADGSRTPFRTPQAVVALPVPRAPIAAPSTSVPVPSPSSSSSSSSTSSKAEQQEAGCSSDSSKVEELERRIRALESLITVDAKKKADKRADKERSRNEKAERKRAKQEATALAKAAKLEAKAKQKEAKAVAKAEAAAAKQKVEVEGTDKKKQDGKDEKAQVVPKVEELKSVQVESVPQQDANKEAAQLTNPLDAENASKAATSTAPPPPPVAAPQEPAANFSSAPSGSSASASASAPAASPVPFSFATFPFSNMVNSITSTVSNTLATAPFAFGAQGNNSKPPTAAPLQPPASAPLFSAVAANSAPSASNSASASSSSSSSSASIWSSPTVSGKRTLADVRAPAFFPYISQLRELETMGFDVDKSIYALRYYRGDMQKSINSML